MPPLTTSEKWMIGLGLVGAGVGAWVYFRGRAQQAAMRAALDKHFPQQIVLPDAGATEPGFHGQDWTTLQGLLA